MVFLGATILIILFLLDIVEKVGYAELIQPKTEAIFPIKSLSGDVPLIHLVIIIGKLFN